MTPGARVPRHQLRDVHGVLLLDKPVGLTSNRALQEAKSLLEARKAGHTGSLDPIATGLLPLCFGEATKISRFFLDADKRYHARLRLGVVTTTGDSEGEIVAERPVSVREDGILAVLPDFVGEIAQVPPMYSAIKHEGQPLYRLARQGIEVERSPRRVQVYELRLVLFAGAELELDIHCSHGFYVRALARDLGEKLGCGAHVCALRRTGVGHLGVADAITLDALRALPDGAARRGLLIPGDAALVHVPGVQLSDDAAFYLCRGQPVRAAGLPRSGWVRLYAAHSRFLGLGTVLADGRVAPKRLFLTDFGGAT